MIKPSFLEPADQPATIGKIFGTPLVIKGWTGFPLIQVVLWGILAWVAGHKRPDWSLMKRIFAGAVTSGLTLGIEWCHNLAHAAIAGWIGKPADAIRIFWGTPLLIYYDTNDQSVSPRQHLMRAMGGPLFNILITPLAWITKRLTRPGSLSRYFAEHALGVNSVISIASLLPIPGLDGGAILKWLFVGKGCSLVEADELVKRANCLTGSGLAVASAMAIKRRRAWLGTGLLFFAVTSLAVGFGLLKEHK